MYQGRLGARLRELRMHQRMSVRELAARTGFSPSFISQVEADQASPSISSLEKIAGQLGITLGQLFSSLENNPRTVVRHNERSTYNSAWSRSIVEVLTDAAPERRLSAVRITIEPGGTSGNRPGPALQDTFALVVTGSVRLILEEEVYDLYPGDTAYLTQGDLFRWENVSTEEAVLLVVSRTGRLHQGLGIHRTNDDQPLE